MKRRSNATFAASTLLLIFLVLCRSAFAHGDVRDELCKLENDGDRAYVAHDRQFLSNLFADEFIHTNFQGGTVDKTLEIDFFTSPKLTMKAAMVDNCTARRYGHLAVVTGINTWVDTFYNGNDLSGPYRFTRVYIHRQRRWQIVASHFSKIAR